MKLRRDSIVAAVFAVVMLCMATVSFAQTTGTLTGTVKDAQGAVIPGATVTITSESRGTSQDTVSASTGDFNFTNIAGDTYTVKVTMDGFKTTERKGVAVSPGDRVSVGAISIEVGTLNETVTVSGEAPLIQAQTGERSFTVTTEAVQNLPIASRNFGSLAALTPGVIGTTRIGSPGSTTNYQIDGVSTIDTGAGGQALSLNTDAIAEVKIVSSGYQAEYGRSIGLQISGVTKSGSNQFRGGAYDLRRNSKFNSNSWENVRNGVAKSVSVQQDWGYTIGGPIGKPGGNNKWFFFYAHQFSPRTSGGGRTRLRVPTLLERQGDFSQTTDNNGNPFPYIYDSTAGPASNCATTATGVHTSCFQDGGVLGRIPQNRLYQIGLNVLKEWPEPNTTGSNFNWENFAPEDSRLSHQPTMRVDWQQSAKLRLSAKYAGQRSTVKKNIGSIPGFNDTIVQFPFTTIGSVTADYTITPTTVFEGTWGAYQAAEQGNPYISPATNKCTIGLCDFPMLYPDANIVPVGSYQEKVLTAANAPMFVNGRVLLAPTFSWGNRISNAPPSLQYNGGWLDLVRTNDVALSVTRLMGRHTVKIGYQLDHSLKEQEQLGSPKAFQGTVNFGNDSNNPIDSQFGFANAALGIFSSYSQTNKLLEGHFIYNSHEWYVQDNWKVNNRLSLDYGLRITHQGENYDTYLQDSNFFSDQWKASDAPTLYRPGCSVAVAAGGACPTASRVAVNPLTGVSLGANTQVAIGTIVPNSGNVLNGIISAGQGINKENYKWPDLGLGPRFGAAYDLTGSQRMVIRGGFGMFYDRLNGNTVYNQVGNPPSALSTNLKNGNLQTLGQSGLNTQTPSGMTVFYYDSELPTSLQWNAGIQMTIPWSSSLDVSYVGSRAYNVLPGNNPDLNSVDLGSAYLAKNQDPTLNSTVPGANAVSTDLMRPYQGLAGISTTWGQNWNGYDSIQMSLNRRFRNGVQATLNYTRSIRTIGNTSAQLRLNHNADGSYSIREDQAVLEKLLRDTGNRPHVIRANFVWDMPDLKRDGMALKAIGAAVNGWQLSGVFTGTSGSRYDAGFSYNANGSNVNLTGSNSYGARIVQLKNPGSGCTDDQYRQFDTTAYTGPQYGSVGLESANNQMGGCFEHITDLSIARNIKIGRGQKQIQLRLDAFNVFNTVIWDGRSSTVQYNSPTDLTVRNPEFNADGSFAVTGGNPRVKPQDAGYGAVNSAANLRTLQGQLRFSF